MGKKQKNFQEVASATGYLQACPSRLHLLKCESVCFFSHVQLFATPRTVICQAPLSMGLSRQKYWSGLPCPPPGDLPDPGIQPKSLVSVSCISCIAGRLFTTEPPGKAVYYPRLT